MLAIDSLCDDLNAIARWLACDRPSSEQEQKAVAIVLLGNQVLATFELACELAQRFPAKQLVLAGGLGLSTDTLFENFAASPRYAMFVSNTMSEAEMYAAAAEGAWGISRQRLLLETESLNAGGNARYSLRVLREAGLGDGAVLLLQDPLMMRRCVLTWRREAELAGLRSESIAYAAFVPKVEPGFGDVPQLLQASGGWTFERFLGLALGEIDRLRDDENGYGPKGRNFFEHVDIPAAVHEAYEHVTASALTALSRR
jgi:uncharacterized SAM-binding protein YcdF (DUF218 family)